MNEDNEKTENGELIGDGEVAETLEKPETAETTESGEIVEKIETGENVEKTETAEDGKNGKKRKKKKNQAFAWIVLFAMIAIQLGRITWIYGTQTTGWHSDEIWSYGLANSYYDPYIYMTPEQDYYKNVDEWITGDTFRDYLTVDENHRFAYGSVTYNMKQDMHPPLFFWLLHTICSFFPGQFSRWYGYAINFVAFIFIQIYLYLLAKKLLKDDLAALVVVFLFGFSNMALNNILFVRQYSLVTLFGLMMMYYHVKLLESVKAKKAETGDKTTGEEASAEAGVTKNDNKAVVKDENIKLDLAESEAVGSESVEGESGGSKNSGETLESGEGENTESGENDSTESENPNESETPDEPESPEEPPKFLPTLIKAGIVTFLGCMSHYYFAIFAAAIAGFFCFRFLMKKDFRRLGAYAAVMLLSALMILPFTGILSSFTRTVKDNRNTQVRSHTADLSDFDKEELLIAGVGGKVITKIKNEITSDDYNTALNIVIDSFLYDMFSWDVETHISKTVFLIVGLILLTAILALIVFAADIPDSAFLPAVFLMACILEMLAATSFSNTLGMKAYSNRYFFIVYPFCCIFLCMAIRNIIALIFRKLKKDTVILITAYLLACLCIWNVMKGSSIYNFSRNYKEGTVTLEELTKDKDCIIVLSSRWMLTGVPSLFMDANDVLVVKDTSLSRMEDEMRKVKGDTVILAVMVENYANQLGKEHADDPSYVQTRSIVETKFMDRIKETFPDRTIVYKYIDKAATRELYVYELRLKH